jgi:hypothetical protein
MKPLKWCLFFDFHTMPAHPEVGKDFDAEATAELIAQAGVDYVVFPARCNLGVAYYPTKIGIPHPTLHQDILGALTRACHQRGIRISAYMNLGLSHEEGLRHRDWLVLPSDGETYSKNPLNSFFRQMCYLSDYGQHAIAMAKEAVMNCDVDGLFLDCMNTKPCIGIECLDAMAAAGVDWQDARQLHAFNQKKIAGMAQRLADEVRSVKPDLLLYFNGVGYEAQQSIGSYLEFECLPTGGWGYETQAVGFHYMRTLGKPVLNMTGRFHRSWGDFGGIRTKASLEYDCLHGLANGMRPTIGDHFHPRGDINHAVAALDTSIYRRLQQLEPWLDEAKPLTEIAVAMLKPYPGYDYLAPEDRADYNRDMLAVKGATRMLCELKQQFDVASLISSWEKYQVLVLPDHVTLAGECQRRVTEHLARGGAVIASAQSGLDAERRDFVLPQWGLHYQGQEATGNTFLQAGPELAAELPDMPLAFYERGEVVSAQADTAVLGTVITPYYDEHWDGRHGFVYLPPDKDSGRPAVTCNEQVGYLSHPVFTSYYQHGFVPMRQLVEKLLARLLPRPMLKTAGAPSFLRATLCSQAGRRMVHLLAYLPETRGAGCAMIEEPLLVEQQQIALREDDRPVREVYLAPQGEKLPFRREDGYVLVTLPKLYGYALLVFAE